MKTKTLGWIVALAMSGSAFVSCSQPKVECQVALASTTYGYATRFTLKNQPAGTCADRVIPGDTFGMEFYHPPTEDKTTYDASKTPIAVQADSFGYEASLRAEQAAIAAEFPAGELEFDCVVDEATGANSCLDNDPTHKLYAMGEFGSPEPDASDLCSAKMTVTAAAEMHFPAVPAIPPDPEDPEDPGMEAWPAKTVRYEWTKLDVFVTAAAPGTQFTGTLKYTEDDCTLVYEVVGMWPSVFCGTEQEDGSYLPDDVWCSPCPDPEAGIVYGSGISPDFPTMCDPDLLICVLKNKDDAPATKIPQLLDSPIICEE